MATRLENSSFLQHLRRLIGRDCLHLGRQCRLVDVLADEGTLVLETREGTPPIQTDQYGQASWRANDVVHVPIFDEGREGISADLLDLLAGLKDGAKGGN